jgi:hypothetical protein
VTSLAVDDRLRPGGGVEHSRTAQQHVGLSRVATAPADHLASRGDRLDSVYREALEDPGRAQRLA